MKFQLVTAAGAARVAAAHRRPHLRPARHPQRPRPHQRNLRRGQGVAAVPPFRHRHRTTVEVFFF